MKHIAGPNSKSSLTNVDPVDVQPNAVDLRLDKVYRISSDVFEISEESKRHRSTSKLEPDELGFFNLEEGEYEVVMENLITVGEGEAGWVITRSSLNRNGIFLTSGLYDSGYSGVMAGCLHVRCGKVRIKRGTRIGQYLSFDSESLYKYTGSYGFNVDGTLKTEEKKYHE